MKKNTLKLPKLAKVMLKLEEFTVPDLTNKLNSLDYNVEKQNIRCLMYRLSRKANHIIGGPTVSKKKKGKIVFYSVTKDQAKYLADNASFIQSHKKDSNVKYKPAFNPNIDPGNNESWGKHNLIIGNPGSVVLMKEKK